MLYISSDPATANSRLFLFHLPTLILAELILYDGTGHPAHELRVATDSHVPDEVVATMASYLDSAHPGSSYNLRVIGRENIARLLPPFIILIGTQSSATLIHHPALGFTAGLNPDGSKIPPQWKDPAIFTPEQRKHFLHQAAETLMQEIAARLQITKRQAT